MLILTRTADVEIVPEDSVIFTSYALHYANNLDIDFWTFINSLKPKAVAVEPCFELYGTETLLDCCAENITTKIATLKKTVSSLREFCNLKQQTAEDFTKYFWS